MKKFVVLLITVLAIPVHAEDSVLDLVKKATGVECKTENCKPGGKSEKVDWKTLLPKKDIANYLQDISVTIKSNSGTGSGALKTRKDKCGNKINFVWTAGHVVDGLRKTRQVVDPLTGTPRTIVEFDDAKVVKEVFEEGRNVGRIEFDAEVIRYSDADNGEDLALLKLRKKNFVDCSVVFYLDEQIPPIGTHLLHVGSLLGQMGSNSMTDGMMSQHGRLINKKIFDQTTVAAFPGSSGGGVYLDNGAYIGMVVRGAGETFNLIVPIRRLKDWAKKAKVEWALNDNVPLPTNEELMKLPIEDVGKDWLNKALDAAGRKPYIEKNKFLLHVD